MVSSDSQSHRHKSLDSYWVLNFSLLLVNYNNLGVKKNSEKLSASWDLKS